MTKTTYEVGEQEKHAVSVDWDFGRRSIRIAVDAHIVIDGSHYPPGTKRHSFRVGDSEMHQVEMRIGFFSNLKVLVDGKTAHGTSTQLEFE